MLVNANQLLFLFFCNFQDFGMKACKTHGVVPINVKESMNHQCFVSFVMNDTNLSCICDIIVNAEEQFIELRFSPKNKFDIFNLLLPCNQDPQVIQQTYNLLHTELSKQTFNVSYKLTFIELAELHARFVDGKK